jgi:hypothetical protein
MNKLALTAVFVGLLWILTASLVAMGGKGNFSVLLLIPAYAAMAATLLWYNKKETQARSGLKRN